MRAVYISVNINITYNYGAVGLTQIEVNKRLWYIPATIVRRISIMIDLHIDADVFCVHSRLHWHWHRKVCATETRTYTFGL